MKEATAWIKKMRDRAKENCRNDPTDDLNYGSTKAYERALEKVEAGLERLGSVSKIQRACGLDYARAKRLSNYIKGEL